jgi:hypothetical protein
MYTDELYGVCPMGKVPDPLLTAIYTRGREFGVSAWGATQRPSWIPLFTLSECEWFFSFRLLLDKDRKKMSEMIGVVPSVPPSDTHGFFLYNSAWNQARYYRSLQARERSEKVV